MGRSLEPSLVEMIKADFREGLNYSQISNKRSVNYKTVVKICRDLTTQKTELEKGLWLEEENSATYSCITDKPIKTLEQAMKDYGTK